MGAERTIVRNALIQNDGLSKSGGAAAPPLFDKLYMLLFLLKQLADNLYELPRAQT